MTYPETFAGFQAPSADQCLKFEKRSWKPRPFSDYDVDFEVEYCGVCGTDLHSLSGVWRPYPFPLAVGHEVVGKVVRVGPKVTLAKVGQRVGVGAQAHACLDCRQCNGDNESYCKDMLFTYGAPYLDTGYVMQGEFSSHLRVHEHW